MLEQLGRLPPTAERLFMHCCQAAAATTRASTLCSPRPRAPGPGPTTRASQVRTCHASALPAQLPRPGKLHAQARAEVCVAYGNRATSSLLPCALTPCVSRLPRKPRDRATRAGYDKWGAGNPAAKFKFTLLNTTNSIAGTAVPTVATLKLSVSTSDDCNFASGVDGPVNFTTTTSTLDTETLSFAAGQCIRVRRCMEWTCACGSAFVAPERLRVASTSMLWAAAAASLCVEDAIARVQVGAHIKMRRPCLPSLPEPDSDPAPVAGRRSRRP